MSEAEDQGRLREIAEAQPPFGRTMGTRLVSVARDRVEAEFTVTEALVNRNGVLHGGAVMGFADNLGGTATFLNLRPGEGTTTVESKTNFFRAVPAGDVARGVCVPLHLGRKVMVWQTSIYRGDGKLAAQVIQTQMILREGD